MPGSSKQSWSPNSHVSRAPVKSARARQELESTDPTRNAPPNFAPLRSTWSHPAKNKRAWRRSASLRSDPERFCSCGSYSSGISCARFPFFPFDSTQVLCSLRNASNSALGFNRPAKRQGSMKGSRYCRVHAPRATSAMPKAISEGKCRQPRTQRICKSPQKKESRNYKSTLKSPLLLIRSGNCTSSAMATESCFERAVRSSRSNARKLFVSVAPTKERSQDVPSRAPWGNAVLAATNSSDATSMEPFIVDLAVIIARGIWPVVKWVTGQVPEGTPRPAVSPIASRHTVTAGTARHVVYI